jgi:uncharacterized Zn finger protein
VPPQAKAEEPERLTRELILKLAGTSTFARALSYQQQGRVETVQRSGATMHATVRGTVPYRVRLELGGRPSWSCDCPVGAEGKFCKHCAALAIGLLEPHELTLLRGLPGDGVSSLRDALTELSREQLEEIVRLAAVRDPRVAQAVETAAAAATGQSPEVEVWAKRIDTAFRTGGFVPYSRAPEWAAGIIEVLDALRDLIDAGYGSDVLDLLERSHRKLERSMGRVDDSGGEVVWLSGVIADLHLAAARSASPEPAAFGRRLAKLELDQELDTFRRSAVTYAGVLGPKGLSAHRKVIEPRWRKAIEGQSERWDHERFVTTEAMVGLALAEGNPDQLVEVMKDRMRTPDDYLEIARAMEQARRRREAIRWSRRGLTAGGSRYWQAGGLREFLASLYAADGDDEAADALWWEDFRERPSVESYRRLIATVRSMEPAEARQSALGDLRAGTESESDASRASDRATVLVNILLYEGKADEGWGVANRYGVTEETWMKLAQAREAEHPLDALPIYERAAAAKVETKTNGGYRDAVRILKRIQKLAVAEKQSDRFRFAVERLAAEHARKRNFMTLLRREGWI